MARKSKQPAHEASNCKRMEYRVLIDDRKKSYAVEATYADGIVKVLRPTFGSRHEAVDAVNILISNRCSVYRGCQTV